MRALIRERRVLDGLHSASSLERIGDFYFVVSDDSSELYRLDLQGRLVGTTRLFESPAASGARIPKKSKPDLEAMCCVEWKGKRELFCFGSGSKAPTRDVCYRVDVTNPASPQNVRTISLSALYHAFRAAREIVGTQTLNLEAAATTQDAILLFQRGNISGHNTVTQIELGAFMKYLDAPNEMPPSARVSHYELPYIKNRRAGFSAATVFDHSIYFAAAVEDTDNEIDDGAKFGSFIGRIDANKLQWIAVVEQDDEIAAVKIEGIAIQNVRANHVELVAVTDDDEGPSEFLRIEIQ